MRPAGGTRLVLWRHGRTEWNASGRYQGQTDIGLDDIGRTQAATAAATLVDRFTFDAIWSSPLSRARDTAEQAALLTGLDVRTDARLMEIDVGSWAGLSPDAMGEIDPDFATALRQGRDHRRSATGETATEVGDRVAAALAEISAQHDGQTLLVASHGLALRMGVGTLLGWAYAASWWLHALGNCHWAEVALWEPGTPEARWRLVSWNAGVS